MASIDALLIAAGYVTQAKVDEARDTSTFQILDYPTLPSYPTRPRRLRTLAAGSIGGIALACAVIILPLWLRRRTTPGA